MDYSTILEKINSEILKNEEIAAFCKRQLNDEFDLFNTSFIHFYTKLFNFLDCLSDGNSLRVDIKFSQECIIIKHSGRSLYLKELLSLYRNILRGNGDILSLEIENLINQDQLLATLQTNGPVSLLQPLLSVLYRVDVFVEDNYYSVSKRKWDNADNLPWQMMFHKSENDREVEGENLIVLFPVDIAKAKSELIRFPEYLFAFLKTKRIKIDSNELSVFSEVEKHEYDNITFRIVNSKKWLVLYGDKIDIPIVSSKMFEADDNTPRSYGKMTDISIDFAIEVTEYWYSKHLYIHPKGEGMVLYKSSRWCNDISFPFICNAPFLYDTKGSDNQNNIVLDSLFNRWLLSQVPVCYQKLIPQIPSSLLKDIDGVNKVLLKPNTFCKCKEVKNLLNEAITNSKIPFIPDNNDGVFYRMDEVFINNTQIVGFDELITKYLEEKYSVSSPKTIHGTPYGSGLIKLFFGKEDAIALVTRCSQLAELETNRYAEFVVSLYLSLNFASSHYTKEIAVLAKNMLFPSADGNFVHANRIVFNNQMASIGNLTTLHHSIEEHLKKRNEKYESFLKFIKSLGAYEFKTATVSGHHISFIEEGFRKTILFLDDSNNIIDSVPFLLEPTERQKDNLLLYNKPVNSYDSNVLLVYHNNNDSLYMEGYMRVEGETYRGIVDKCGKFIIPFGYGRRQSKFIHDNLILYGDNNTWSSLFSLNGNELFPGSNDECYGMQLCTVDNSDRIIVMDIHDHSTIRYSLLKQDLSLIPFEESFYNQGRLINKFVDCGEGLIIAISSSDFDQEISVIDDQGRVIIPTFNGTLFYYKELRLFEVYYYNDSECNIYDYDGNYRFTLKLPYQNVDIIHSNNLLEYPENKVAYRKYEADGFRKAYFGLITTDLNICFPIICDSISPLETSDLYRIEIDGKQGVFSTNNNTIVIPTMFDHVRPLGMNLICGIIGCQKEKKADGKGIVIKGGTKQLFTTKGKPARKGQIFDSVTIREDYILAKEALINKQRGKMGVFDENLNIIVPFEYDLIIIKDGLFLVNNGGDVVHHTSGKKLITGGKWGVYSVNKAIIDCIYDKIIFIWSQHTHLFFRVKNNGKEGIIDREGNICIPISFDYVFTPIGDIVRVNNGGNKNFEKKLIVGGKWFFYDMSKSSIISPEIPYEYVGDLSNGFIVFIDNGKYGYLNTSFNVAIKPIFDFAYGFDYHGKAQVILDGKRIIIDKWANQVGEWGEKPFHNNYDPYEESGYSSDDLDEMYRSAFEGDPSAEWNVD